MTDSDEYTALDGIVSRSGSEPPTRMVWIIGILEAIRLAILLINLAAGDVRAIAQAVGPIHGLLYLSGIALVWTKHYPRVAKALVVIPAIGTLLAARLHRRRSR